MSQTKAQLIAGTSTQDVVFDDVTVNTLNGGPLSGARNLIINGDTRIDQRNAGAALTLNNSSGYSVDRWNAVAQGGAGSGTATVQRVVDAPAGFTNSIKWTTTNAKTPAAGDGFYIWQPIEGLNIDNLGFNTSSAKPLTLSFWVKSSLTGTFSGFCRQQSSLPTVRSYVFTYTISVADTWEYKTVNISADLSSGFTPATNTSTGLGILFDMGSGSTYEAATPNTWATGNYYRSAGSVRTISTFNATWQITGVQLETGTSATLFERRTFPDELRLAQRYFEAGTGILFAAYSGGNFGGGLINYQFKVTKRAAPVMAFTAGTGVGSVTTFSSTTFADRFAVWWNGSAVIGDYREFTFTASTEL
jgi:hypothetical protein